MCFDFRYKFSLKHFSFHEKLREIFSKMKTGLYIQYRLFLSDFYETPIFLRDFRKIELPQYQILYKTIQLERRCSILADRQTNMTNLIFAFHNFSIAPKKTQETNIHEIAGFFLTLSLLSESPTSQVVF